MAKATRFDGLPKVPKRVREAGGVTLAVHVSAVASDPTREALEVARAHAERLIQPLVVLDPADVEATKAELELAELESVGGDGDAADGEE